MSFLTAIDALGQDSLAKKPKEIFFGIGSGMYRGDLKSGHNGSNLIFVAGIKLNTQKKLHGNFNLTIGTVSGQELDYMYSGDPIAEPNTFFKTSIFGLNYDLQYNVYEKNNLRVYLSQGIGVMRFEVKDEFSESLADQASTRAINEEYRNLAIMLPTMIGVQYKLSNGYGVALQTGFYNVISDYLDNISAWGERAGNDNIFSSRLQISIPLK